MWHLFRYARSRREHLTGRFDSARSLWVVRRGRIGTTTGEESLLEVLGENPGKAGRVWTPTDLLEEGARESGKQGVPSPDERDQIHYGLYHIACKNPVRLRREDKVARLIRASLYAPVAAKPRAVRKAKQPVLDKFAEVLLAKRKRSKGRDDDELDRWLLGPKNNIPAILAGQKRGPLGKVLPREVVRAALQDLGWDAYYYVGGCLQALLKVFMRLLPTPLGEEDVRVFEQMYLPQPHFGGLPFFLIAERFREVYPIIHQVWEHPEDRRAIGVMHRLLDHYSELASRRRRADRRIKDSKVGERAVVGRPALTVSHEVTGVEPVAKPDLLVVGPANLRTYEEPLPFFAEVAEKARAARAVKCRCTAGDWIATGGQDEGAQGRATFTHYCRRCKERHETSFSLHELRGLFKKSKHGG
jgi:hypothetical protein